MSTNNPAQALVDAAKSLAAKAQSDYDAAVAKANDLQSQLNEAHLDTQKKDQANQAAQAALKSAEDAAKAEQ